MFNSLALSTVVLQQSLGIPGLTFFSCVSSLRAFVVVFAVVILIDARMTTTLVTPETWSTVSDVTTSVSDYQGPLHWPSSPVWEHFLYNLISDKIICQVEQLDSQSLCGQSMAGKLPTNLKKHLKLAHSNVLGEIMRKEEDTIKLKAEKERVQYHLNATISPHSRTLWLSSICTPKI